MLNLSLSEAIVVELFFVFNLFLFQYDTIVVILCHECILNRKVCIIYVICSSHYRNKDSLWNLTVC